MLHNFKLKYVSSSAIALGTQNFHSPKFLLTFVLSAQLR
jgi:hypothetical protein